MVSYDARTVRVEYYRENQRGYRARRLAVAAALTYAWLFLMLIIFWIYRNVTGLYERLTVPPYGSGSIHLLLCLGVVVIYALGNTCVPRHMTVGLREGSLPSVVRVRGEGVGRGAP